MKRVAVRIARVHGDRDADLALPTAATELSAGVDLRACIEKDLEISPGQRVAVPTGLAIALPPGYEGQVRPRSGLALRDGLTLLNAPGTIDSDYRGELHAILYNAGEKTVRLSRGDRIAQLVVAPVVRPIWDEVSVKELGETPRGAGGFGHTGRD